MTVDERIAAELRSRAPQVDEHDAWDKIRSALPVDRRSRTIRLVAVPVAAAGLLLVGSILVPTLSSAPGPVGSPESPFEGTWVTIDEDGSTPTMTIEVSTEGAAEIVVVDDFASVCSGATSTMTGTGRLEADTELVIPTPVLTCDDGSVPQALSGPPLEEQLRNLTLALDPPADTLTDNLGSTWTREGSGGPSPEPEMGWWPQSSLAEVRGAQELADAGDPDYTWQVDPKLDGGGAPWGAEIFARFIEEELGWEEFVGGWDGSGYLSMGVGGGVYEGVTFIRCAPGQTNPLNSLYADAPPEIRGCAPTIDEFRYETVSVDLSQPGRKGPDGIWVVDQWEILQPKAVDPGNLFGLIYPEYDQVEQVVPPSEAEVTAFLEAFLQARVGGEGAEQYLLRQPEEWAVADKEVPLLYVTTSGALYERFEIETVQGPVWPTGWTEHRVRLFAEGGSVVEQYFHVVRDDGQLGLIYGLGDRLPTTENGQSVPVPFSMLEGEVTFAAAPPWSQLYFLDFPDTHMRFDWGRNEHVVLAADPVPDGMGCEIGPAAADAEALARSIKADPNLETTEPVPVRVAGVDGLQMDVAVPANREFCYPMWAPEGYGVVIPEWRLRLYLIDYPGESAQVLTIAVIAPWTGLEGMVEAATPILESIEFHTG